MDAHSMAHAFLNGHDWYRVETPLDYLRAALWCAANLVTAVAYFFIPAEIGHWQAALPFATSTLIGRLFMGFIAFCGLSHLSMLAIMQTAPWWAVLTIYLPMALVSVATVLVLRRERSLIVAVLSNVGKALRAER
ncbi:MAG TPA: hypothetical protein VHL34_04375 [Rhizomicrobium sp.]|jgi:hypothetical protein|nr:hypothetical protein [Rhizomicrobium sp.]